MTAFCVQFLQNEQGQDLIEYTLLLSFLMFVVIGLALGFKNSVAGVTALTNSNLAAANGATH